MEGEGSLFIVVVGELRERLLKEECTDCSAIFLHRLEDMHVLVVCEKEEEVDDEEKKKRRRRRRSEMRDIIP